MSKMWVMTIGYQNYAVSDAADAVKLVEIASRMVRVSGYSAPYVIDPNAPPLMDTIILGEVTDFPEVPPSIAAPDPMFAEVEPSPAPATPQPVPFDPDNMPF